MAKLFYTKAPHNDGLVFAPPDLAEYVSQVYKAIRESKTWGEFKAAMPTDDYNHIAWSASPDGGDALPQSIDPFDSYMVPGYDEGDYPVWLQQDMDSWLPPEIIQKFAQSHSTAINGSFWLIPSSEEETVCADLRSLGFELEHRPDLNFH